MYTARVVGRGDEVVLEMEGWFGSEEEAVRGARERIVGVWRERRGNFF